MKNQIIKIKYHECWFKWDSADARKAVEEQKIGFDEAMTAFHDPNLITQWLEPFDEINFTIIGMSKLQRLLLVSGENKNDVTQIFSVKPAGKEERNAYIAVNARLAEMGGGVLMTSLSECQLPRKIAIDPRTFIPDMSEEEAMTWNQPNPNQESVWSSFTVEQGKSTDGRIRYQTSIEPWDPQKTPIKLIS